MQRQKDKEGNDSIDLSAAATEPGKPERRRERKTEPIIAFPTQVVPQAPQLPLQQILQPPVHHAISQPRQIPQQFQMHVLRQGYQVQPQQYVQWTQPQSYPGSLPTTTITTTTGPIISSKTTTVTTTVTTTATTDPSPILGVELQEPLRMWYEQVKAGSFSKKEEEKKKSQESETPSLGQWGGWGIWSLGAPEKMQRGSKRSRSNALWTSDLSSPPGKRARRQIFDEERKAEAMKKFESLSVPLSVLVKYQHYPLLHKAGYRGTFPPPNTEVALALGKVQIDSFLQKIDPRPCRNSEEDHRKSTNLTEYLDVASSRRSSVEFLEISSKRNSLRDSLLFSGSFGLDRTSKFFDDIHYEPKSDTFFGYHPRDSLDLDFMGFHPKDFSEFDLWSADMILPQQDKKNPEAEGKKPKISDVPKLRKITSCNPNFDNVS